MTGKGGLVLTSSVMVFIWVVVDQFSKMAHFVPLPGLLAAHLVTNSFNHIFHVHGLPQHIALDHGIQFTTRF